MSFIDKLKFHAWDNVGVVVDYLGKWRPRKCSSEKDFENSLFKFLHEKLPDFQVTKQHAQGRIRADLVVGGKVIIEIKNNLNTTAKYQRLVGQLSEYREWRGRVVILLTGETDPNLLKQLKAFLKREELSEDMEPKVTIFEK